MYKHLLVLFALINVSSCSMQNNVDTANVQTTHIFQNVKEINLLDNKGIKLRIGSIHFTTVEDTVYYNISFEHKMFKDYFLSMKEMKCLEGPELWCHLAYPYSNPRKVTINDFRWLSHDLLFMYKKKSEFGANFYNGIYYDFNLESDRLIGTAMAIDLNLLAAPPEDQGQPPISMHDIEVLELVNRWLPRLEIK